MFYEERRQISRYIREGRFISSSTIPVSILKFCSQEMSRKSNLTSQHVGVDSFIFSLKNRWHYA